MHPDKNCKFLSPCLLLLTFATLPDFCEQTLCSRWCCYISLFNTLSIFHSIFHSLFLITSHTISHNIALTISLLYHSLTIFYYTTQSLYLIISHTHYISLFNIHHYIRSLFLSIVYTLYNYQLQINYLRQLLCYNDDYRTLLLLWHDNKYTTL